MKRIVQTRYAHSLKGMTQGGLHRPLPTGFDLDLLRQTRRVMQTVFGQPLAHCSVAFAQGLFLQGLE